MSTTDTPGQGNPPPSRRPPLWRRIGKLLLRWPVTIGLCILASFVAKHVGEFIVLVMIGVVADPLLRAAYWLRYGDHDIRKEVRALSDRGMMRRYWLCTMACRYYITIIFEFVAWFGAQTWFVAALLLVAGLIIDALRARQSPDLYLKIHELSGELDLASAGQPGIPLSRRPGRDILILWPAFIVYMIVVLTSRPENLQGYMSLFTPLHDLTALFLDSSRRIVGQLTHAGLPDRALLAAHVFAISWLVMIVSVIWITPAAYTLLILDVKAKGISETARNGWTSWTVIVGLAFALAFYLFVFDWLDVNFSPKRGRSSFHVHESNGPYHILVLATPLIATFFLGTYFQLARLRIQLWRGWQERLSPKAPSGDM